MGGHPNYRVKKGRTIHRKVSMPSSIRKNYCTDLLLLTSRKKSVSVRKKEKSNTCKLGKFQSLGDNRTDSPPSSSTDTLTTDLLEAPWREWWKINYYYTSHTGPVTGTYWTFSRKKMQGKCNERKNSPSY